MDDYRRFLQPSVVAQLKSIELKARLVVEGFMTGLHRSPYHGFSVEFAEHRQYNPGDEIKHIDWKVFARTDKYFVKQFEEETNLRCIIAIDKSASMRFASKNNISKYEYSAYLAAALAYLLMKQRDAVGLALYDETLHTYLPPRSKSSYIAEILKTIDKTYPTDRTGTAKALNQLAEKIVRRGLVVIFSDFFDDPESVLNALKHFRHKKHEVIAFQVLDPQEIDFKYSGSVLFKDMETAETLQTQPLQLKKFYREKVVDFINQIKRECFERNIDFNVIRTDEPFDKALRQYLTKRATL
ncbi:MAG: hypothetical protein CH6_3957 [Candidatus Kapaibacterium sp.]|nr:MAG: hypothetical protein CH6_3957 [Candidatus Kapabacteria bacterium]